MIAGKSSAKHHWLEGDKELALFVQTAKVHFIIED
jgi:hypothetical protein